MAEEPQPNDIHEGASAQAPLHAEDRRAAAALSSLETQNDEEEGTTKAVDTEALGKAMKNLDVKDKPAAKEVGKKVKIEAADVTLLVCQDFHTVGWESPITMPGIGECWVWKIR